MMKFMTGTVEHQLDGKNRIRIPAKFRAAFNEKEALYFVRYNEDRIAIMSESVLYDKMSVLEDITPADRKGMNATAKILGSIEELSEDNQKRVMIPRYFLKAAKIEKDVVTVGMGKYVEVWAKEIYEQEIGALSVGEANSVAYGRKTEKQQ